MPLDHHLVESCDKQASKFPPSIPTHKITKTTIRLRLEFLRASSPRIGAWRTFPALPSIFCDCVGNRFHGKKWVINDQLERVRGIPKAHHPTMLLANKLMNESILVNFLSFIIRMPQFGILKYEFKPLGRGACPPKLLLCIFNHNGTKHRYNDAYFLTFWRHNSNLISCVRVLLQFCVQCFNFWFNFNFFFKSLDHISLPSETSKHILGFDRKSSCLFLPPKMSNPAAASGSIDETPEKWVYSFSSSQAHVALLLFY